MGSWARLAWTFVLSSFVLTPLTVVAFALGLTARTTAIAYVLIVASSPLVVLARRPRPLSLRRIRLSLASPAMWVALTAVAVTLLLPGTTRYDAQMHSAKILLIREVGFTLQDPYSPLQVIHTPFIVNVIHVYHVVGSFLTSEPPLEFWRDSARFFRLIEFGGMELLALSIFRRSWLSALAVLASVSFIGLTPDNAVPAVITADIILPLLFVQLFDVLSRPSRLGYAALGISGTVLSAMHVGHWVLWLLCIGPVLVAWSAFQLYRRAQWTPAISAGLAAFLPGVPLFLMTALQPNHAMAQMGNEFRYELSTNTVLGVTIQNLSVTSSLWIIPTAAMTALLLVLLPTRRFQLGFLAAVFAVT